MKLRYYPPENMKKEAGFGSLFGIGKDPNERLYQLLQNHINVFNQETNKLFISSKGC